jgi:hypothetical protein
MIYKLLLAGVGIALSYTVARKLSDLQAKSAVKAKTNDQHRVRKARLRQDPETGVYYPED